MMTMNLRADKYFVEDDGWHKAAQHYEKFLHSYEGRHTLFWELGVGYNTPGIIKYPFWQMTNQNPRAFYVSLNNGEAVCPTEIESRSICINKDIAEIWKEVKNCL
jgi:hypothetical protein